MENIIQSCVVARNLDFSVMEKLQNYFSALSVVGDEEFKEEQTERKDLVPGKSVAGRSANGRKESVGGGGRAKKETEQSSDVCLGSRLRLPLVWIDLEMSGLDLEKDRILEIACIMTDGRLERTIEGPDLIVQQPEEVLAGMGEWCQQHHTASGLVAEVRESIVTEKQAEEQVLGFVRQHKGPWQPTIAGNSVYVDLMFLRKYMPTLAAEFSHVVVDVSSIRALCVRWYPRDAERAPTKKQEHRALEDIKESIAELKYLRRTIFKQPQR